ncbi:MAG: riboflavin biosynthesis protein RibF [Bacteroidales bacterium]
MKIHHDFEQWKVKNPVITVGTFDGVHIGHRSILNEMRRSAEQLVGETVVFTFWPHPRIVLGKTDHAFRLLNTLEEKIYLFEKAGVDHLLVYPFTPEFSGLPAEAFVEEYLVRKCGVRMLVMGYNHHLGRNREGGFELIRQAADRFGFKTKRVEAETVSGMKVSSTSIREFLQKGDLEQANRMLGEPYPICGTVDKGNGVGTGMGFPTANIRITDERKLIPPDGVYAVQVFLGGKKRYGMMNIGFRPTLHEISYGRTIEVHIFGLDKDIYGEKIVVSLFKRIRTEKKFDGMEALREQLFHDKREIMRYLGDEAAD